MSPDKKSSVRKFALIAGILFLMISSAFLLIRFLNGDKIKSILITELNKHLEAEASVKNVNITIIRSFPDASLVLGNVELKPPKLLPDSPGLLKADKISLNFNIISLITGKYDIKSMSVNGATINIYEDHTGKTNLNIWKSETTGKSNDVNFNIRKIVIKNTAINYKDLKRSFVMALQVKTLNLKGALMKDEFNLKLKGNCYNRILSSGKTSLLPEGDLTLDCSLDINTKKETIHLQKSQVDFDEIKTALSGLIKYGTPGYFDIDVHSAKSSLRNLTKVLPADVSSRLKPYDTEGNISTKATIKGNFDKLSDITVDADFEIERGVFNYKEKDLRLKEIAITGKYNLDNKKGLHRLNIGAFSGNTKTGKFNGKIDLTNLKDPNIQLDLNISTDIEEFSALVENEYFKDFKGKINTTLNYKGKVSKPSEIDRNLTGQAILTDAAFIYNGQKIRNLNGTIEFKEDKFYFDGLALEFGDSDIKANGYINNIVYYFVNDRRNIHADLNLYCDKLNIEDLLKFVVSQSGKSTPTSIFPPNITFGARLSVGALSYKKLKTGNLTGNFNLKDDVLRGSDILINALGGKISADGVINGKYGNKAKIITTANFQSVDISKLFYEFDEFGQTGIMSTNLKGTADAKVLFSTSLYMDYSLNTESIEAIADLKISNGELNNFKPLQALSRFLDANELQNVKFSTLTNRIEIINKTVIIPSMEINSSALNLAGYGTHSFGNEIDYHVNMLVSDVLRAKKKRQQAEIDNYIEDDGYGKPRIFLKISGLIDKPVIQYDTKAVSKKIATDLKNEKQVFRDVIRKEFGKKSENPEQDKTDTKTGKTPEFKIEWDEIK